MTYINNNTEDHEDSLASFDVDAAALHATKQPNEALLTVEEDNDGEEGGGGSVSGLQSEIEFGSTAQDSYLFSTDDETEPSDQGWTHFFLSFSCLEIKIS